MPSWQHKMKILTVEVENCRQEALKHFREKPIPLNFKNLKKIFCLRFISNSSQTFGINFFSDFSFYIQSNFSSNWNRVILINFFYFFCQSFINFGVPIRFQNVRNKKKKFSDNLRQNIWKQFYVLA